MISDYTQVVLHHIRKVLGEETQLNLDAFPLRRSWWLSMNIWYVLDSILCDGIKTAASLAISQSVSHRVSV